MRLIIAGIIVIGLVSFYFISWNLNKKSKLPDDFKRDPNLCESCGHSGGCGLNSESGGIENE